MLIRAFIVLAAICGLGAVPATAQSGPPPARVIRIEGDRLVTSNVPATFPRTIAGLAMSSTSDSGQPAEGMDLAIQYRSPDGAVFATVYMYLPSMSHAGLAAFMTDYAITSSSPNTRRLRQEIVAAGGVPGAAIRLDYDRYRNDAASSAAFIKVDRWIVKLRVSGPGNRVREVDAAMRALLDGIVFTGAPPHAAAPIAVSDCAARGSGRAAGLRSSTLETRATYAIIGDLDPGGNSARLENGRPGPPLPSRIGASWCVSSRLPNGLAIMRAVGGATSDTAIDGRSAVIVMMSDAGNAVEIVQNDRLGGWQVIHHQMGVTNFLGAFDAEPNDAQVTALFTDRDNPAARLSARLTRQPDGNTNISIEAPPSGH